MIRRVGACMFGLCAATIALAQFDGDVRLDRHVTLRFEANPVREVLLEVKKQTGVELTVAQDISEDLVILLWRDKPAVKVLKLIAEHFNWTWEKRGGEYRLLRTNSQRDHEEKLRLETILAPYRELQAKARARIQEIRNADPLKAKELYDVLSKASSEIAEVAKGEEVHSDQDRKLRLEDVFSGWSELVYSAFRQLSDAQLLRLHTDGILILNTEPTRFQERITLDPALVRVGLDHRRNFYKSRIQNTLEAGYPEVAEMLASRLRELDEVRFVRLRFRSLNEWEPPSVSVHLRTGSRTTPAFGRGLGFRSDRETEKPMTFETTSLHSVAMPIDRLTDWRRGSGGIWFIKEPWNQPDLDEPLTTFGKPLLRVFDGCEFDLISDAYDAYADFLPHLDISGYSIGRLSDTIA